MIPLIIFLFLIIFGAALLVIIGLRESNKVDPIEARIAEFAAQGVVTDLENIELSQPITERIIFPLARKLGELTLRLTQHINWSWLATQLKLIRRCSGRFVCWV